MQEFGGSIPHNENVVLGSEQSSWETQTNRTERHCLHNILSIRKLLSIENLFNIEFHQTVPFLNDLMTLIFANALI